MPQIPTFGQSETALKVQRISVLLRVDYGLSKTVIHPVLGIKMWAVLESFDPIKFMWMDIFTKQRQVVGQLTSVPITVLFNTVELPDKLILPKMTS